MWDSGACNMQHCGCGEQGRAVEMGAIVTSAIHKGGTGKTTAAVALAFYAQRMGLSVLLVDLDSQGNASRTWVTDVPDGVETASRLFLDVEPQPAYTAADGIAIIAADPGLLGVERLPLDAAETFKKRLQAHAAPYDLVIVDTPPTMGFAMLAPLMASDFVFSPIIPDAYGIDGVSSLFAKVKAVQANGNKNLKFLGLLINRWNRRNRDQSEIVDAMRAKLGANVMPFAITDRAAIANAAHRKAPVWRGAQGGAAKVAAKEVRAAMAHIVKQMNLKEA